MGAFHSHATAAKKLSVPATVQQLKQAEQDFEFYPTTTAMLDLIKADIESNDYFWKHHKFSMLDCGAGNGSALMHLTEGDRFAIEKSEILVSQMDKSICIVGTDFNAQTLIDKRCDLVFCNPPYSVFLPWIHKILREANCGVIYAVIPTRWKDDPIIPDLLELRQGKARIVETMDFFDAERQARAKVDIVCFKIGSTRHGSVSHVDPFDLWFNETFDLQINTEKKSKYDFDRSTDASIKENLARELVSGVDIISVLTQLYERDLEKLFKNYKAMEDIDPQILSELGISHAQIKKGMQMRIEGLKDTFWTNLLDNMHKITDRLCAKQRRYMLERFMQHVHVDFTASNAYAVVLWVLKHANDNFDTQLIEYVVSITNQESVIKYKSNQRTIGAEQWRYLRRDNGTEQLGAYKLDYRFIVQTHGGICSDYFNNCNLRDYTIDHLNDLLTVANNLGFDITGEAKAHERRWESNKAQYFYFKNHDGQKEELAKIRCFKNGNIHMSLNQRFICKLNVEFGRLQGWIKSAAEAVEELEISLDEALESFNCNLRLEASNVFCLEDKKTSSTDSKQAS